MTRRKYVPILLSVLLAAVALAVYANELFSRRRGNWVELRREPLVMTVEVTGELAATEFESFSPPQLERVWDFKISMMAPEGSEVQKGMPVLAFDTSELDRQLQQKMVERDSARKEIERRRADVEVQSREETLKLAEAQSRLRKAEFKIKAPPDLLDRNERRSAEIEHAEATREVAFREDRVKKLRGSASQEIGLLEGKLRAASFDVNDLERAIRAMHLTASRSGVVVYSTNHRGEKKKVGDDAWRREEILQIPDLSRLEAKGEVDESDAAVVAVGQRVSFNLDAHPDDDWSGTVRSISRSVQRQSFRNGLKILPLRIALTRTDQDKMRPGMRFRGSVERARIENALLLPLDAVTISPQGPTVLRRTLFSAQEAPVRLGRRNAEKVEVLAGLHPKDRVLVRRSADAEAEEKQR